ncbi:unnamed protein product [Echinostoma caproni]|uniref:Uncharacterized protein n=1 Tax=Echinostoma caproni TaxID=27848 RepID=A0A183BAL4_9TREM|nr:unnamed protein product [Echinostoma caproni]
MFRYSYCVVRVLNSVRNFITTTSTIITNWPRAMELPSIEQLNLQASPSEIEEWVERFDLWCSIRKGGVQNQSALFLATGGRYLYPLLKNLAFPEVSAKLPNETLKSLLLITCCLLNSKPMNVLNAIP